MLKIKLTSILVDGQDQALKFYTQVLGFRKKQDFPVGAFRWITVVSPAAPDEVELALEPNENPAAKVFQRALRDQGIPYTAFAVDDIAAEYDRLTALGVAFKSKPMPMGPIVAAVFDDTCGNWIQIYQPPAA